MIETPTGLPDCPLCDWVGDPSLRKPCDVAPALADVLGVSPLGLYADWEYRRAQQLEGEILAHYETHPVQEWALALLRTRAAAAVDA